MEILKGTSFFLVRAPTSKCRDRRAYDVNATVPLHELKETPQNHAPIAACSRSGTMHLDPRLKACHNEDVRTAPDLRSPIQTLQQPSQKTLSQLHAHLSVKPF